MFLIHTCCDKGNTPRVTEIKSSCQMHVFKTAKKNRALLILCKACAQSYQYCVYVTLIRHLLVFFDSWVKLGGYATFFFTGKCYFEVSYRKPGWLWTSKEKSIFHFIISYCLGFPRIFSYDLLRQYINIINDYNWLYNMLSYMFFMYSFKIH